MSRRIVLLCCSVYILIIPRQSTSALPLSPHSGPHSLEASNRNVRKTNEINRIAAPLASESGAGSENSWHMGQIVFRNIENNNAEVAPLNTTLFGELYTDVSILNTPDDTTGRTDPVSSAFTNDNSLVNNFDGSRRRPKNRQGYVSPNYTGRDHSNGIVSDQLSAYTNGDPSSGNANIPRETESSSSNQKVPLQPHNLLGVPRGAINRTGRVSKEKQQADNENYAVRFMQQFGYVPEGDSTSGFLFTTSGLQESIKNVQKFGDIPQTGELDEQTLQLMKSPRCGVPDIVHEPKEGGPKGGLTNLGKKGVVVTNPDEDQGRRPKRYVLGGGGWNKRTITYHIENHSSKLHTMKNVEVELEKAFAVWSSYARLNFTLVPERDADIIIYFAQYDHYDGYPFDGQGGTLAHAYYPYEFGHYGGDIHFDESEQWAINPKDEFSGLDFFTVASHEIGHSLGLAHSYVRSSIMFPYYKGNSDHFALDHDDVMGMYELYIRRHLPGDEEYFNQQHGVATTTTTTTQVPTTSTTTTRTTTTESLLSEDDDTQSDAGSEVTGEEENDTENGKGERTGGLSEGATGVDSSDDSEDAASPRERDRCDTNTEEGFVFDVGGNEGDRNRCKEDDAGRRDDVDWVDTTNASNNTASATNTTILYHGDSMSVDEYHRNIYGPDFSTTKIPVIFPTAEEVWRKRNEEEERKRRDEEELQREVERKWYEEEELRAADEERRREQDRKAYEEEVRKKEEEAWKQYQEELQRREAVRKAEEEKYKKEQEDRYRKEDEARRRAYEEERRRYEEGLQRRVAETTASINSTSTSVGNNGKSNSSSEEWDRVDVSTATNAPDLCSGDLDSVAQIQDDLFMFKGEFMWRYRSRGVLRSGYPAPIRALFHGLPSWTNRLDAVYQRRNDSVIMFFVGKYFFEHRGDQVQLQPSPPRPLTDLGLPDRVTQLDAAFYWPKNAKVYFFRHEEYWRYNEQLGQMEQGYPQSMDRWHGVPSFLDAAYTWDAAVSYFFKGSQFWEFDNMNVHPVEGYPKTTKDYWFPHC